jgi:hypothetical protein
MNYLFNTEHISQHIVKYGADVRPTILPDQEKTKLQDYGNWLIEQFPVVFETLLSGPKQLQIQGTFILADGKRAQFPTFVLTARGPVFTFPERLFIAPTRIKSSAKPWTNFGQDLQIEWYRASVWLMNSSLTPASLTRST